MTPDYRHWGQRVFEAAIENPHVDEEDEADVMEHAEEWAEKLMLDESKLKNYVEMAGGFSTTGSPPDTGRALQ